FAPQGATESRKAALTIQLDARGLRPRKQVIEGQIRAAMAEIPGVRNKMGLGGSGEKYILAVTRDDPLALQATARQLERELRTIPGLDSVQSTAALVRTEIYVQPDVARAADLGVTSAAIANTLRVATVGDYDSQMPKLNLPQRQVPIMVRLEPTARHDLSQLGRLAVPVAKGPVMLSQVADLSFGGGPAMISRVDRTWN